MLLLLWGKSFFSNNNKILDFHSTLNSLNALLGVLQLVHEVLQLLHCRCEINILGVAVRGLCFEVNHVHKFVHLVKLPALEIQSNNNSLSGTLE